MSRDDLAVTFSKLRMRTLKLQNVTKSLVQRDRRSEIEKVHCVIFIMRMTSIFGRV